MDNTYDIDPLSIDLLDHLKKGIKDKSINKKNNTINIILHKNNLKIIDFLSRKFNVSRSYIINYILKKEIESMFYTLSDKEKVIYALEADRRISSTIEINHIYNNETWTLKAKKLPEDYLNPSVTSVVFDKSKIKDMTNE
eukprot:Anaeramoba_ignava/a90885_11.p1 GENE.a90885_11~~a90885_11.p1  ORF type:complete len:140 (-),score=6.07 a90885_11:740-1159(-)